MSKSGQLGPDPPDRIDETGEATRLARQRNEGKPMELQGNDGSPRSLAAESEPDPGGSRAELPTVNPLSELPSIPEFSPASIVVPPKPLGYAERKRLRNQVDRNRSGASSTGNDDSATEPCIQATGNAPGGTIDGTPVSEGSPLGVAAEEAPGDEDGVSWQKPAPDPLMDRLSIRQKRALRALPVVQTADAWQEALLWFASHMNDHLERISFADAPNSMVAFLIRQNLEDPTAVRQAMMAVLKKAKDEKPPTPEGEAPAGVFVNDEGDQKLMAQVDAMLKQAGGGA